jgi:hypothetical protein
MDQSQWGSVAQTGNDNPTRLVQRPEVRTPFPSHATGEGPRTPPLGSRLPSLNGKQIALLAVLLVVLVGSIALGVSVWARSQTLTATTKPSPTTSANGGADLKATVSFSDGKDGGRSNALNIAIQGLQAPAAGTQYHGWVIDEQREKTQDLGALKQEGQNFTLSFSATNANLIGGISKVLITQEQGNPSAPSTDKIILSAQAPAQALVHVRHLEYEFPATPNKIGLLIGLREQTRLLNTQAALLNQAFDSQNNQAVQCALQSMTNLIEGRKGADFKQIPGSCSRFNVTVNSDGFGLLGVGSDGYIPASAAHAVLAATQSDSTQTIKLHSGHVTIATDNLKKWVTNINNDVQSLFNNPTDKAKVNEIVKLANASLNGQDINNDERVDPIPDEAGANLAYIHGQLMAQLSLQPNK